MKMRAECGRREKGGKAEGGSGLTKGVPKIPDIQLSLTDQTKVISPINRELGEKH
jgi:hypothetical protein